MNLLDPMELELELPEGVAGGLELKLSGSDMRQILVEAGPHQVFENKKSLVEKCSLSFSSL